MKQEPVKKVKKVEELQHFPFKDFKEFNKANLEGIIQIGIDRLVALRWAQGGIYSSRFLRMQTIFLMFLPYLAAIGFIVYSILSKNWLLLLALPIFFVGFFLFSPGAAMIFGPMRSGLILLTFIAFIWSLLAAKSQLLAITITLLVIWYALRTMYRKAVNRLTVAVAEHEDLLCLLWQSKVLNIRFYNGNTYWVDWKIEDGKHIHYNE